jgi:hypothetical protein
MRSSSPSSYSDIADQLNEISALSASMSSATASAAAKMARGYTQAFDQIGAGWKRAAAGLLAGTMTWQQAGVAATRAVETGFVSLAETALSQAAAGPLAALLGLAAPAAGQGVGSVLGSGLSGLIGKQFGLGNLLDTGDQAANTAALSTNTAALAALATTMAAGTAAVGGGAAAAGASAAATAGGLWPAAAVCSAGSAACSRSRKAASCRRPPAGGLCRVSRAPGRRSCTRARWSSRPRSAKDSRA